ncbi:HEPN-associated N-terminal domain-containing protein [Marinobacter segnicrescens]|uniref:HEPN-associated N-terminal domain-containing protein n=1 Tax=Marinobacter segnicrescens TaxID=430453 RepID=UPI003A959CD5
MGTGSDIDERGFGTVDTYVCEDCVKDPALAALVSSHISSQTCSYCGLKVGSPFEPIMERIYESICTEYADAQDIGVPWDKGWVIGEVEPFEVVDNFNPGWDDSFTNDVLECLGWDKYWVEHSQGDWGLGTPSEALTWGWNSFRDTVLYKTRYLFLTEPEDEFDRGRPDYIPVRHVLNSLSNLVKKANLVTSIDPDTSLFRARVSMDGQSYRNFSEVSVPPADKTTAGRMNPAGIPYLYAAFDQETARSETLFNSSRPYAMAEFKTKLTLKVLDLSSLPAFPSPFEPDRYNERHEIGFLHRFQREISKRVSKDGREHIEYIPTQIVSEFFRHRFLIGDQALDGIVFPSAKNEQGKNIALFASEHSEVERVLSMKNIQMSR